MPTLGVVVRTTAYFPLKSHHPTWRYDEVQQSSTCLFYLGAPSLRHEETIKSTNDHCVTTAPCSLSHLFIQQMINDLSCNDARRTEVELSSMTYTTTHEVCSSFTIRPTAEIFHDLSTKDDFHTSHWGLTMLHRVIEQPEATCFLIRCLNHAFISDKNSGFRSPAPEQADL